MVVTVSYANSGFVPAPIFSWSSEMVRDARGSGIGIRNTLDFTGTILETSGVGSKISNIISDRNDFINALKTDHGELRILENGSGLLSGVYPTVLDFNMDEGVWFDQANYSFSLTYDESISVDNISDYTETWSYQENDDRRSVALSHNLSAVGINTSTSGNNSLSNARTFVTSRIGSANQQPSHPAFVQVSGSNVAYEGLRTEDVDIANGSFGISETFTLSSGAYTHSQTASLDISDGISTVSLQGEIQGLGRGDSAFTSALSGWDNQVEINLPSDASGVYSQLGGSATLFTGNTTSRNVSKNDFAGTINYNYSYTDDELENLPSGVESFDITFVDTQSTILFASFPIFGRTLGNVVQNIGTPTEGKISIAGSAKAEAGYLFTDLLAYAETRINSLRPLSANYVTLRLSSQSVTKDEAANELQFNLQWSYTKSLSSVKSDGPASLGS